MRAWERALRTSTRTSRWSSFLLPTPIAAKEFYGRLGWRLDADVAADGFRLVQFTPPGSGCSIQFGVNLTSATPGSVQNLYLVVSDIDAAHEQLSARGVEVSEVFHKGAKGARFHDDGRVAGPSTGHSSYGSFATFPDPDGNGWLFQEVTTRSRPCGPGHNDVCVGERSGGRPSPCVSRPRRA